MIDRLCVAVATGLYLSYIPALLTRNWAPARSLRWTGAGFLGTLLGWALLYALPAGGAPFGAALAAGIAAACWASHRAEKVLGRHDDPRIIVDETVGFWAAAAWLPREPLLMLSAFVLFRALDAAKPPPVRWFERLPGGAGVVLDDVCAGAAANLIVRGFMAAIR